ncbi:hypothetical protein HDC34_000778 [Pseudoclavibacter sp. JAI123]|uniref:NAD(P)H-binding protein n=1 Tax=Pseudoclavibacter sp. JAI123 TaxID=2723065 RepID=UPI0017BCD8EA|nr:NAD(P)H-binding protein [Pseudoclavibacter sp. JAI123]NYF12484.1 hypothetical protein [Pseudoclavibacter sp. JAI123]
MRATFEALDGRRVRVALMTSSGVTVHDSSYNWASQSHDWKRRAERLVRASGSDDTILRPAWFDESAAAHPELLFLQGDTRRAGSPEDDSVARSQIARVLVESVTAAAANRKTLELVAERAPVSPTSTPSSQPCRQTPKARWTQPSTPTRSPSTGSLPPSRRKSPRSHAAGSQHPRTDVQGVP